VEDAFTVENGLLGNTMKVKRTEVVKKYAQLVDQMFTEQQ
jgi:long-subunit acyl-CoA synthetase (AMP-forming)